MDPKPFRNGPQFKVVAPQELLLQNLIHQLYPGLQLQAIVLRSSSITPQQARQLSMELLSLIQPRTERGWRLELWLDKMKSS